MNRPKFGSIIFIVIALGLLAGALAQEVVTLRAWTIGPDDPSITRMTNLQSAVEQLNAALEAEGADVRVELEASFDSVEWDPYLRRALLAFDSGDAPDIIQAAAFNLIPWQAAGFLEPLDDFIAQYEQFSDVVPSLWNAVTFDGQRYGIIQDTEARPLYFNKSLLAQLGWSDDEIANLPDRISSGEFTWDDVLATASEALEAGVITAGNGYFHRPKNGPDFTQWYRSFGSQLFDEETGKLVWDTEGALRYYSWLAEAVEAGVLESDRLDNSWDRYHATILGGNMGQVLFFSGGTWNWAEWSGQAADKGGQDWLWDNFGFAPHPSWERGGSPITQSSPQAYAINEASSNKELAARLLAFTTVPEFDGKHAVDSGHLPILGATPSTVNDRFIAEVSYLLDFTTFVPPNLGLATWQEGLFQGVSAVESGDLSPEEAVQTIGQLLQSQLGDEVVIK